MNVKQCPKCKSFETVRSNLGGYIGNRKCLTCGNSWSSYEVCDNLDIDISDEIERLSYNTFRE